VGEKHEAVMKPITASETSNESADDDERRRMSKLEKNKGGSKIIHITSKQAFSLTSLGGL
jgi:hypothetical protein